MTLTVRGPETRATPLGDCPADGEWLGIRLKLGTVLPLLPARTLVDATVTLPEATSKTFWLGGSAWQFPDYDNADTFVAWLVRAGLLLREPIVGEALQGRLKDLSLRSVQRRFLQATGVTQNTARQIERARSATLLLRASRLDPGHTSSGGLFRSAASDPSAEILHRTNTCSNHASKPAVATVVFVQDNALFLSHTKAITGSRNNEQEF